MSPSQFHYSAALSRLRATIEARIPDGPAVLWQSPRQSALYAALRAADQARPGYEAAVLHWATELLRAVPAAPPPDGEVSS